MKVDACGSVRYFLLAASYSLKTVSNLIDSLFNLIGETFRACQIPNHRTPGICVASKKCAAFTQLAEFSSDPSEMKERKQRFIREIQCQSGRGWLLDLVCCPLKGNYK